VFAAGAEWLASAHGKVIVWQPLSQPMGQAVDLAGRDLPGRDLPGRDLPGLGAGLRILVVEDEVLIAGMIEEALTELGCIVIGPTGRLDVALRLAQTEALDGAMLDVSIQGGSAVPVVERLRGRGVSVLVTSGGSDPGLAGTARLDKPFSAAALRRWVAALAR
jgi:CheY-like chemotaxis protein